MAPKAEGPRYPISRKGKAVLRAALSGSDLSLEQIGARFKVTRTAIVQLGADRTTGSTKPTWSCTFLPELCDLLGVSLWDVVAGPTDAERRLLKALDLINRTAPDRADGLLADFVGRAEDVATARGWKKPADGNGSDDVGTVVRFERPSKQP